MTPPNMSKVRRLLIVKLSAIGDVVHALPFAAAMKDAFPHVEISWIVEPLAAPLLEGNPSLTEVIVLPQSLRKARFKAEWLKGLSALRRDLRARQFEMAVDLQGLSKSALVASLSGAALRYGYDWLRELAPRLETRVPRRPESVHIVDQFLDVARFLGADVGQPRFPIQIADSVDLEAQSLLEEVGVSRGEGFIAVNPSAGGGGNKGWPAARFAAALEKLNSDPALPTVLVGSKGDLPVTKEIVQGMGREVKSLVGRTTLKQLCAILRRSSLHLCGDTGSAHIAAALGTRVVSLFGRSNPARLAPYGQEAWAIHHRECCAAPCLRFHETAPVNSRQKCLAPPPICMNAISVDEVVEAVRRGLS